MELNRHDLPRLFDQLGLDSDPASIEAFIRHHQGLPDDVLLPEARIWSASQAAFLREKIRDDSDWAIVVDALSVRLRRPVLG